MRKAKRGTTNTKRITLLSITVAILSLAVILGTNQFAKTHFKQATTLQGINCSFLTVEEAAQKLQENLITDVDLWVKLPPESKNSNQVAKKISSKTNNNNSEIGLKRYNIKAEELKQFELQICKQKIEEALKKQLENKELKQFEFENLFSVNEKAVRDYLKAIPELNGSNMVQNKNAYLKFNEESLQFEIVPEVCGNEISFEKAYKLVISALKNNENYVNFSSITETAPEVLKTNSELVEKMQELNNILSTSIYFSLLDNRVITLDASVIKEWIVTGEENKMPRINVEDNLPKFIDYLADEASKANTELAFHATDIGYITLPIKKGVQLKVDKERQYNWIIEHWGVKYEKVIEPCYSELPVNSKLSSYVELDITRQLLWLYVDGKQVLESPVVTGNVSKGHDTPTGIYYLSYKTTNVILTDNKTYWSPVDYWMPFNGGIGFHDAYNWRSNYGGDIYLTSGSHGCVNMPLEEASTLYKHINSNMPIIIYKS